MYELGGRVRAFREGLGIELGVEGKRVFSLMMAGGRRWLEHRVRVQEADRRAAIVGLIVESGQCSGGGLYSPMNGLAVSSTGSRISRRGGGGGWLGDRPGKPIPGVSAWVE